jgi:class 3 adenylate cyclase
LLRTLIPLVRAEWGMGSAAITSAFLGPEADAEDKQWLTNVQQKGANRQDAAGIMEAMLEIDVRPLLERVAAPTLVVHGTDDTISPFANARALAAGIPNATVLPYPGMHFLADSPGEVAAKRQIIEFITGRPVLAAEQTPRAMSSIGGTFRTVLFTDLVGHTEMMARLGDERGREVLREHERITRDALRAHGGTEVKTDGDSFMVSFGSVTRAVECAIALQRAFATHSASSAGAEPVEALHVRVGLNAGEPIEEDNDLFGSTVILASRIAAQAGAGEILVPDTVRGLCSGKGFLFTDRGEFVPKGFDEAVRLYAVRWQE